MVDQSFIGCFTEAEPSLLLQVWCECPSSAEGGSWMA